MKKRDLNFKLGVVLGTIIGLFVICHLSPQIALRTHLFFSGHPISSVTTGITLAEKVDANTDIYQLQHFEVKRYSGIFYFAEYVGEV